MNQPSDRHPVAVPDLLSRDQRAVWHPFTPLADSHKAVPLTGAAGCYLHTADGRQILDCIGSWWVNLHGHSHPHIAEAIYRQARQLEHVIFAGFTHEPAVRLAERLLEILPANQSKIFYSDNGSTAVEVGLKMAFQYWHNQGIHKPKIVALDGAYHGDTFGAMSVGERGPFTAAFHAHLFEVAFLPFPDGASGHSVIQSFNTLARSGEVAAFVYEPLVQGAAGMRAYPAEVLEELLQIAKAHGILCIADEVMTGFGRTGKLFASAHCVTQPDIMCLSKGLTGGALPLGVTSCTAEVIAAYRANDLMKTFFHGHSFTANPLACAAANASLDLLLTPECEGNRQRIARRHAAFAEAVAAHPAVLAVRSLGVVLALEIRTSAATSYFNEVRNSLYDYFLGRDLLIRPLGNVIYLLPPYVITDAELDRVYAEIETLLDQMIA
ncbi:MAG: Adenosylmethionine-8-amino-7-oxononanoate aminotransferase [uncultured Cytophagales bacterium]|uniref:Adenosylmethionine-8-amino-7-oxononanoate aminotransferase n=1 Tax=uncultured Cytophagales bacterium TaxID=158755 RepID=A0A6J4KI08_9SPHI|nr:MAG: Adenosylmethionine-8-amino-7-oxononanoate aminotransferase [uncultured Cytophagales bacterium]